MSKDKIECEHDKVKLCKDERNCVTYEWCKKCGTVIKTYYLPDPNIIVTFEVDK